MRNTKASSATSSSRVAATTKRSTTRAKDARPARPPASERSKDARRQKCRSRRRRLGPELEPDAQGGPRLPRRLELGRRRQRLHAPPELLIRGSVTPEVLPRVEPQLIDEAPRIRDAVLLQRVRSEPALHHRRPALPLHQEALEEARDPAGVDAGLGDVAHAFSVRLELVVPAVPGEPGLAPGADRNLRQPALAHARQGADDGHPDVRLLRLLHLLDRVPERDVRDLVTEHPR